MAADGVFQSQLTKMAAEDATILRDSIGALPPGLKQLAREVVGLGAPISDTSKELTAISDGRFNDAIKAFQKDLDPVAFSNAIKTISADVMNNSESFGQAGLVTGQFADALNAVVEAIGTAVDPSIIQDELDAVGDNIKNLRNITSKLPTTTKPESETLNIDDILPKPGQNDMGEGGAQFGTRGFRDFGAGTPMMLHGSEMVLPERNVGELAEKLANAVSTLGSGNINTNTTVGDTITNNSTTIDLSTLNANTRELIALTEKTANHLNTLVTIGTMTEKNTKSTNKSLADMGGSLV